MAPNNCRSFLRLSATVTMGSLLLIGSQVADSWDNWFGAGNPSFPKHSELQFIRRKLKSVHHEHLDMYENDNRLGDNSNAECRDFHTMPNITDICTFVNETDDCQVDEGFINYTFFVYCTLGDLVPLAVAVLFLWWLFLFVGLAVTADDFFCPSLAVISATMRLSHNIAIQGVTFLAFGNGAPDIFSAIAAIGGAKNGDAGLAVGALFGAGVFVTTVVAGVIAVVCPFDAMQRPFLRDVIFYLAAVFFAFYVLWRKEISKFEALGFIGLYIVYVLVVVIGRYIYQRGRYTVVTMMVVEPPDDKPEGDSGPKPEDNVDASLRVNSPERASDESTQYNIQDDLLEATVSVDRAHERSPLLEKARVENYSPSRKSSSGEDNSPFKEFLQAVNPIDTENWLEMKIYKKGYEIFKSPLVFILKLTIPVVDYTNEDNNNWNRYLNSLHCFTGPVFGVMATKVGFNTLGSVFPVWGLVMILGAVLGITVFCVTRNEEKPRFHAAFAYLGFVVAVIWIYSVANEIVNILQTFGIVFNISNAILGLTFLAWGNSIGDLIADFAMARQGYPRMGISACFGGPLFNMLLGIGIPFTIGTFKHGGNYTLRLTLVELILAGFLCLSLISSLIIVPLSKFHMSRPYGIFLFMLYGVFIVVAMLAETNVIHAKV